MGPASFSLAKDKAGLLFQAPELLPNREKIPWVRMLSVCACSISMPSKGQRLIWEHARVLGERDDVIYAEFHRHMAWLGSDPQEIQALLDNAMSIGLFNYRIMEMLDKGETETFGDPEPNPG